MADNNQELDLDQLDKAVSALMDQATKGKSSKTSNQPKPASSKPADSTQTAVVPADEPPVTPADDDDVKINVTIKRPTPQISRSRGGHGRAMDVISPAPKVEPKPMAHPVKREAPTLQPTGPITVEPPKPMVKEPTPLSAPASDTDEPSDDLLASIDMQDDKSKPVEHTLTHHKTDMPDPLDVHGFKDEQPADKPYESDAELPESTNATEKADDTSSESVVPETSPVEQEKPAEQQPEPETGTPFVKSDVEKRPLGAYASEPATEEKTEPATPTDKVADQPAAKQDVPTPSILPPQTPKELSPEVVAVESSEPEHIPTEPETTDIQQLGQMSIPQQYQAEDKTASTASRPVFDTKDYHPPIEAHARSHRGIGSAVMLILFILILGSILAVAYFVITGSVDLGLLFG